MALEVRVVNVTVRENIGNSVAHRFADAQLALRAAGSGSSLLVMARHVTIPIVSSPAKAGDPVFRIRNFSDYWMPRLLRGMTVGFEIRGAS